MWILFLHLINVEIRFMDNAFLSLAAAVAKQPMCTKLATYKWQQKCIS